MNELWRLNILKYMAMTEFFTAKNATSKSETQHVEAQIILAKKI